MPFFPRLLLPTAPCPPTIITLISMGVYALFLTTTATATTQPAPFVLLDPLNPAIEVVTVLEPEHALPLTTAEHTTNTLIYDPNSQTFESFLISQSDEETLRTYCESRCHQKWATQGLVVGTWAGVVTTMLYAFTRVFPPGAMQAGSVFAFTTVVTEGITYLLLWQRENKPKGRCCKSTSK